MNHRIKRIFKLWRGKLRAIKRILFDSTLNSKRVKCENCGCLVILTQQSKIVEAYSAETLIKGIQTIMNSVKMDAQ